MAGALALTLLPRTVPPRQPAAHRPPRYHLTESGKGAWEDPALSPRVAMSYLPLHLTVHSATLTTAGYNTLRHQIYKTPRERGVQPSQEF